MYRKCEISSFVKLKSADVKESNPRIIKYIVYLRFHHLSNLNLLTLNSQILELSNLNNNLIIIWDHSIFLLFWMILLFIYFQYFT